MKILITGASGFIGTHLQTYLKKRNTYTGSNRGSSDFMDVYSLLRGTHLIFSKNNLIRANLLKKAHIETIIEKIKPDVVYHLAAQSLITSSWENPIETFHTNIDPTVYLLEAIRTKSNKTRIIIVGSSSEYEKSNKNITETSALLPNSPYALSKLVQDHLGLLYHRAYGLDVIRIRPFNIIGPGKKNDSIYDFCKGIIAIEKGKQKELSVGNLEVYRDFLDIEDFLEAMDIIMKKGIKGKVYNICSSKNYQVKKVLEILTSLSKKPITVHIDKHKFRPIDEKKKIGDNTLLQHLGWRQQISIDTSLSIILDYWRQHEN